MANANSHPPTARHAEISGYITNSWADLDGDTVLFQSARISAPIELAEHLAVQGILVRTFEQPGMLRFGLATDEQQWQRLEMALITKTGVKA